MTVTEKFVDLKGGKKKAKQKLLSEDQNIRKYKAFIFMQK